MIYENENENPGEIVNQFCAVNSKYGQGNKGLLNSNYTSLF